MPFHNPKMSFMCTRGSTWSWGGGRRGIIYMNIGGKIRQMVIKGGKGSNSLTPPPQDSPKCAECSLHINDANIKG